MSQRLNRRKIDLIPEPEWADPPKARIAELLLAVEERCGGAGSPACRGGRDGEAAREAGLRDPRVTSDAKHVEIGLTDKSDAARWVFADLGRRHPSGAGAHRGRRVRPARGLLGSDSLLLVGEGAPATAVTVGASPRAPDGVLLCGGGPAAFLRVLEDQLRVAAGGARRRTRTRLVHDGRWYRSRSSSGSTRLFSRSPTDDRNEWQPGRRTLPARPGSRGGRVSGRAQRRICCLVQFGRASTGPCRRSIDAPRLDLRTGVLAKNCSRRPGRARPASLVAGETGNWLHCAAGPRRSFDRRPL